MTMNSSWLWILKDLVVFFLPYPFHGEFDLARGRISTKKKEKDKEVECIQEIVTTLEYKLLRKMRT